MMIVAGLHLHSLVMQVAMPVLLRMHVPGLQMNLRAMPVAILVSSRLHMPGPYVKPRTVPLAMVVAWRMDVPGPRMPQPHAPSVPVVPRMLMPSPVVTVDDEGTVVRGSQSHADAERLPVPRPLAGCRAEQSADDATHDRAFP